MSSAIQLNEPEEDFGAELAEIAMQLAQLMHLAARLGLKPGSRHQHRELLTKIMLLSSEACALADAPMTTPKAVDAMTERYRDAMSRMLNAIKLSGPAEAHVA